MSRQLSQRPDRVFSGPEPLHLFLLLPLALSSCGGDDGTPQPEVMQSTNSGSGPAHQSSPSEGLDILVVNENAGPSSELIAAFEPETQGWDTEVFQDLASAQLKRVAHLLIAHDGEEEALDDLFAADFTCPELLPDQLGVVHEDDALRILRLGESGAGQGQGSGKIYRGVSGFMEAAAPFVSSLKDDPEPHSKFKIFNVELGEEASATNVLLETWGPGGVHHSARWRCHWIRVEGQESPLLQSIEVITHQEMQRKQATTPLFADVTESVLGANPSFGETLQFGTSYWRSRLDPSVRGTTMLGHLGVALGDVNGDGLDDLLVSQIGGLPNQLFVQNPDGTATDVTATSGVGYLNNTHGALFLDLDNDGDQDLVFPVETNLNEVFVFLENDGKGHFTEAAQVEGGENTYSIAAADFDQDGDLDIYCCRYAQIESGIPDPYHDANNGPENLLLRNDGDWNFVDCIPGTGLDQNNRRFSFAAAWEDYDNDGDVDLYVANDFGRNNLYRNDGGDFTDVAAEAGVEDISAGMGVTWGDYDRDGWVDIYVSNMYSNAGNRVTYQRRFEDSKETDLDEFQRHAKGSTLFRNMGDGTFRDVSFDAGVTMGRWAWSSRLFDVDNNGFDDILTVNGFFTGESSDDL